MQTDPSPSEHDWAREHANELAEAFGFTARTRRALRTMIANGGAWPFSPGGRHGAQVRDELVSTGAWRVCACGVPHVVVGAVEARLREYHAGLTWRPEGGAR